VEGHRKLSEILAGAKNTNHQNIAGGFIVAGIRRDDVGDAVVARHQDTDTIFSAAPSARNLRQGLDRKQEPIYPAPGRPACAGLSVPRDGTAQIEARGRR
jgi:hypothetical protein